MIHFKMNDNKMEMVFVGGVVFSITSDKFSIKMLQHVSAHSADMSNIF